MHDTRTISWVIKSSKLCNLRCSYCYEWNELDHKDRIGIDLWRRIFHAIRDFADLQLARYRKVSSLIVLHGGEPLLLPVSYLREVFELKNEILGADRRVVDVVLQTNAFSVSDAMVDFLKEARIRAGVSHDVIPGVRLSVGREPVETRVAANIDRLRAAGVCNGGIAVLAAHTVPKIRQVYDWYAARKLPFRVLPLFDGPDSRPGGYMLSSDEISQAMCDLFDHWITTGARVAVTPFTQYVAYVIQNLLDINYRPHDRGIDGDTIFLVNTTGDLYHIPDAYRPGLNLGNLGADRLQDILASDAYWASVNRDRDRADKYCRECEYRGSCGGTPLQQAIGTGRHTGRCPVVYNFLNFVKNFLITGGYGREELMQLLLTTQSATQAASATTVAV